MAPRKPIPVRKRRKAKATSSQSVVGDEGQVINEQQQNESTNEPSPRPHPGVPRYPKLRNPRQAKRVEKLQTAEDVGDAVKNLPPDLVTNLGKLFCNLYLENYKASRGAHEDSEDEGPVGAC